MDKMTIVDRDGTPKYELTEDNKIVDLQYCVCSRPTEWASFRQLYQIKGTEKICLICNKPIPEENNA